jgi:hypothetical protein
MRVIFVIKNKLTEVNAIMDVAALGNDDIVELDSVNGVIKSLQVDPL